MRRGLLTVVILSLLTSASAAQTVVIQQRPGATEPKSEVRVQVNMSFFVAGAVNNSEVSLKSQEDSRRMLYDSAGRECDVLRATIASDCRIESINVNINRNNYGGSQPEGFTANGNFGFKVTLK